MKSKPGKVVEESKAAPQQRPDCSEQEEPWGRAGEPDRGAPPTTDAGAQSAGSPRGRARGSLQVRRRPRAGPEAAATALLPGSDAAGLK